MPKSVPFDINPLCDILSVATLKQVKIPQKNAQKMLRGKKICCMKRKLMVKYYA